MGLNKTIQAHEAVSGAANWTKDNLVIDPDYEIDNKKIDWINVSIEVWFDADAKFGVKSLPYDESWVNLYADYNPITDELKIWYTFNTDDTCELGVYEPSEEEKALVIEMISAMLFKEESCSPRDVVEQRREEQRILTCDFCGSEVQRLGNDGETYMSWECELCDKCFCRSCFVAQHGSELLEIMTDMTSGWNMACPDCFEI